ncbi:response regulator [Paraconexibacter antarcticus]|uniref:Response regulator n=1 Tax=Paraconexibacter antarcticus TaxID=2949664 RepID=A0ABY5DN80_9ACTN|nr:response regulator [Paraconexibacter antarcticus]UTI63488.1 response regulator [Paraconexibacter antarcticus]
MSGTSGSQFQPASVLLVEDNLADVRLTVELLREARVANRLTVVGNGSEALSHLRGAGLSEDDPPLPDLVLLDLDLPGTDGRGVLAQMRAEPRLRHIPVFVLTASVTHRQMVQEEELDADGFLEKPIDLDTFVHLVTHHDRFWLELVCSPAAGAQ